YSDLAIETALFLRQVFHLPLRQTEGFMNSLSRIMKSVISIPDGVVRLLARSRKMARRRNRNRSITVTGSQPRSSVALCAGISAFS
ncbi:MAG: Transposase, partial [Caballeronia mineralivorans]|nr:Transposase [Caballeronia mineralivorans]